MVVRTWEGRARPGAGGRYLAHLTDIVIPQIRELGGNQGVQVVVPREAQALLEAFDERARHFDVAFEAR